MNRGETSDPGDGDRPPARKPVQLQGPRPSPLSVNKHSRKIRKRPGNQEPVIIYDESPKVIHTDPADFMSVVQRLTGLRSSPAEIAGAGGPISLAATERARVTESEVTGSMDRDSGEFGSGGIPGSLSPAPADLPAGMFSSGVEEQTQFGLQDDLMSPSVYGNCFLQSPSSSALFSGDINLSPTQPSPVFDISSLFENHDRRC